MISCLRWSLDPASSFVATCTGNSQSSDLDQREKLIQNVLIKVQCIQDIQLHNMAWLLGTLNRGPGRGAMAQWDCVNLWGGGCPPPTYFLYAPVFHIWLFTRRTYHIYQETTCKRTLSKAWTHECQKRDSSNFPNSVFLCRGTPGTFFAMSDTTNFILQCEGIVVLWNTSSSHSHLTFCNAIATCFGVWSPVWPLNLDSGKWNVNSMRTACGRSSEDRQLGDNWITLGEVIKFLLVIPDSYGVETCC